MADSFKLFQVRKKSSLYLIRPTELDHMVQPQSPEAQYQQSHHVFFSLAIMLIFKIFKKCLFFSFWPWCTNMWPVCYQKKRLQCSTRGLVLSITKFQACWTPRICVQFNTQPNPPPSTLFSNPSAKSGSALNSCVRVEILCHVILWKVFLIYSVLNEKDRPASDRGTDNLTT